MGEIVPVELTCPPPAVIVFPLEGTGDWAIGEIKTVAAAFPGDYALALAVGRHRLVMGPEWRVSPNRELVARLETFGRVEVCE